MSNAAPYAVRIKIRGRFDAVLSASSGVSATGTSLFQEPAVRTAHRLPKTSPSLPERVQATRKQPIPALAKAVRRERTRFSEATRDGVRAATSWTRNGSTEDNGG